LIKPETPVKSSTPCLEPCIGLGSVMALHAPYATVILMGYFLSVPGILRSANAGHASIQSAPDETCDCQSGFNLLNALESGFHGHSGSDDFTLHVSEQIARLVVLIDGEFSRG